MVKYKETSPIANDLFTMEVNPGSTKLPLKFNGGLAKPALISLVNGTPSGLGATNAILG